MLLYLQSTAVCVLEDRRPWGYQVLQLMAFVFSPSQYEEQVASPATSSTLGGNASAGDQGQIDFRVKK